MHLATKCLILFFLLSFNACDMSKSKIVQSFNKALNVYGETLSSCCNDPMTGFYRDGYCRTGVDDVGTHIVCARVTDDFLQFSKSRGNDLTKAIPGSTFPGLKEGDKWCLCVLRWMEAHEAGHAPPVDLKATHLLALDYVSLDVLKAYAIGE